MALDTFSVCNTRSAKVDDLFDVGRVTRAADQSFERSKCDDRLCKVVSAERERIDAAYLSGSLRLEGGAVKKP